MMVSRARSHYKFNSREIIPRKKTQVQEAAKEQELRVANERYLKRLSDIKGKQVGRLRSEIEAQVLT